MYFVVAEALTNLAKHSRAKSASITAWVEEETLLVEVRDDGVGGANPEGSGLRGLADRVAALGGELRIESAAGAGTHVFATLPLMRELQAIPRGTASDPADTPAPRAPDGARPEPG